MARRFTNQSHIEGKVYDHSLAMKVSGDNSKNPGTPYINGNLMVATDDAGTNVVTVHFSYVTPTTANGNANASYNVLKNIAEGKVGTWMNDGKDAAGMVRIDSAIGLNDWYNNDGELVSTKRNEGGFVHTTTELVEDERQRSTFKTDIIITGAIRKEADDERGTPERMTVKGAIFDFRGALLPVEYSVTNPKAMDYFEGLDASSKNPVATTVWGQQISTTIKREIVEESVFGEPSVRTVTSSQKDFLITGASPNVFEWDSEESMTAAEFKKAIADREVYLAETKARNEEYQASRNAGTTPAGKPSKAAPKDDGYNF